VNDWYDHSLYSRLNDKATGAIVIIMQRLHEDDLVGHVLAQEAWEVVSFPAIAEQDQEFEIDTPYGSCGLGRKVGEVLHPEHESGETLERIRQTIGPYNFAGQYQQAPAPLGGGMIKAEWFKTYEPHQLPEKFDHIVQSWDTANKATELSDYSVCTTWGEKDKHLYLLNVLRKRLEYPALKRAVRAEWEIFRADVILIEDKASGTQLIQELIAEGIHAVTQYKPDIDKIMRMHAQTAMIENGFVYLPHEAHWLAEYLREIAIFPNGKHDDQVDSTAQALDWVKRSALNPFQSYLEYYRQEVEKARGRSLARDGKPEAPKMVRMRAPKPYANYYMSGVNGRAGRYTSDANGILENVHPEDVERLLRLCCTCL
jgi:predicted phage terminase large subunit-like protein